MSSVPISGRSQINDNLMEGDLPNSNK